MGVIIPRGVFQGLHYQSIFPLAEKQDGAQTRSLIKLLNIHMSRLRVTLRYDRVSFPLFRWSPEFRVCARGPHDPI